MKNLSSYIKSINEAKRVELPAVKLTSLTISDLDKFVRLCGSKFLSNDSQLILEYMKKEFADKAEITNLDFINKGWPNNLDSKVKAAVLALMKEGRIKELPMYLTDDEFKDVLNENRPLDFFVYDLVSEQGRNEMVERFKPMISKAVYTYSSKNVINKEDALGAALEGFTVAMNNYGKKRSEYVRTSDVKVDLEKIMKDEEEKGTKPAQLTFAAYAKSMVNNWLLEFIQDEERLVRVPRNKQAEERKKDGSNKVEYAVRGDASVGSDEEGGRTMWDKLAPEMDAEDGDTDVNDKDVQGLWKKLFEMVEKKFGKEIAEQWYTLNGLNGYEKAKVKNPNYYKMNLIKQFITTDPKAKQILNEIHELMLDD